MVESTLRIVATGDNHLNRFYDRMTPQKLAQRRSYLRKGFKAAVDHAVAWPAHLFLIVGDLFDQPDPRNAERTFVAECLRELREAGVRVYAVGGNHDTPRQSTEQGGYTPQEIYHVLGGLTFFDTATRIATDVVEIEGLKVAIGGMSPDPTLLPGVDPLDGVSWEDRPPDVDVGIVLLHGQMEGHELPETREPVFSRRSLEGLEGADVIVMGDIHKPAILRFGRRMVVMPGATERMTFGEDPKVPGYVTLALGRGGVSEHSRVQLQGQPREELSVHAPELDATAPTSDLVSRVLAVSGPETMVKLKLWGAISRDRYHALDLRRLHEEISPQLFHFTLDTAGLLLEDAAHQAAGRGERFSQQEEINLYASELMEVAAEDSEERSLLHEAVQRLLGRY